MRRSGGLKLSGRLTFPSGKPYVLASHLRHTRRTAMNDTQATTAMKATPPSRSWRPAGHHHHEPAADAGKVKDPVCGMMVDPHTTKHRAQYEGKPYYFCSAGCQSKFMADPANTSSRQPRGRPSPCPRARSTPARCIPRSGRWARAPARSAAWRSNPSSRPPRRAEPRTRRHDAPLLDRPCAVRCRSSPWRWAAI